MNSNIKNCIECDVELDVSTNWYPSFVPKHHYKCTTCYDRQRIKNHVVAGTAGPKTIARHLGYTTNEKYDSVVEGYVYIISNPAWGGWKKVGMAIDAYDRCSAFQTSSPLRDFKVEYCKHFSDRRVAEKKTHEALFDLDIERAGEWFKTSTKQIKQIIQSVKGEYDESINSSS